MNSIESLKQLKDYCGKILCRDCTIFSLVEQDLNKLLKYRELFDKIKNSDPNLEYNGYELIKYYKDIENDK